jgi:hypothetical protein
MLQKYNLKMINVKVKNMETCLPAGRCGNAYHEMRFNEKRETGRLTWEVF